MTDRAVLDKKLQNLKRAALVLSLLIVAMLVGALASIVAGYFLGRVNWLLVAILVGACILIKFGVFPPLKKRMVMVLKAIAATL